MITDFAKGIIAGFALAVIIAGVVGGLVYFHNRDKEILEYAERQIQIDEMREDIINRDTADFLEIPDVRRAADGASAEFDRKRDEIMERFRSRYADR
jgi:hypothetical protein